MSLNPLETQGGTQEAPAHFADRVDTARHRGMKNALQALRPGLLICDPVSFDIRYANDAAREALDLEVTRFPVRLPEQLSLIREEDDRGRRRTEVPVYRAELDGDDKDARAVPVYSADGRVESVMVVIRDYAGISWSLFEMLDKLPIAVVAVSEDGRDVRYINRTAVREIFAGRAGAKARRTGKGVIGDTVAGWWKQAPADGEGRAVVSAGKLKLDMHFSRLVSDEGEPARLVYWDARVQEPVKN